MTAPRSILHVDMDAFYASVEQRERPELRGRPVIVGGAPQSRGVVSAASYEAREFGVHSAMPSVTAHRLCPQGVFLPPRIDFYARVGRQVREILQRFTPLVEPLSLDEAFLDVTGSFALFGPAVDIGRAIKRAIHDELALVASVGVAPNKFLAKIASDFDKPDGFTVVDPERIHEFLDPLPIRRLWGVGKQAEQKLHRVGIHTIGQLRGLSPDALEPLFGPHAAHLHRLAQGQDERPVVPDHQAVSISHETTFAQDVTSRAVLRPVLQQLTDQVARRLRRMEARAKTVHLKVRYSDFATCTRSHSLPEASDSTRTLWQAAAEMFDRRLPDRPLEVRLVGVGVSHLLREAPVQKLLFDEAETQRDRRLDAVRDDIAARFGRRALRPGTSLDDEQPLDERSGPA